ncbi:N-carbamoylsarcosine amidohydrolase [Oceanibacterium hippocampi]|uniref:Maleamate amidohydrolase n=1 Tax=Oceanibacterium hippocampi TaxID=745714 RepID=A0A1Y5TMS4_9PROT|nr:N-carbamoylsarcosine amidohydrolase [Oceanibacterium hippocampi]SLN65853.1 Maleamate amidohydrolase [Oceanibacterium hippocampi]
MNDRDDNYSGVFDGVVGFGTRPAVLVIDFIKAYTTPGAPLYAADVQPAAEATAPLLEEARRTGVPVIYTRVLYHPTLLDGGLFVRKVPALQALVPGEPLADIVEAVTPKAGDVVLVKNYASAFFGTSLAATLTTLGIDTLILTGCSTSGCVRATAVDGLQHGYRVVVPRECVADRHPDPHEANLFDINAKYGDVMSLTDVLAQVRNAAA